MSISETVTLLLEKGIPFYAYRLPGEREYFLGAQLSGEVMRFDSVSGCAGQEGFIAVPFSESEEVPAFFIRGEVCLKDFLDRPEFMSGDRQAVYSDKRVADGTTARKEYHSQVSEMIHALQCGKIRKMVLSRGIRLEISGYEHAAVWFERLCCAYPDAFVFLLSVPGIMAWMGATPEVFLRQLPDRAETMALAGTRPVDRISEWGEKEKEEQEIVSDYIAHVLGDEKKWKMKGPFSKRAAQVEHLCTSFTFSGLLPIIEVERIRKSLHPTPAVGGFPVAEAVGLLKKIEGKDRRYYAGYLGPVYRDGTFQWFVNLRSMEIFPEAVRLYVGGGITALSDPLKEWEETELKSRTLLEVIRI